VELEAEVRALEAQAAGIVAAHERDPDAEARVRRDALVQQNAELDARIQAHTVGMIPPAEVPRFLERLLQEQEGLELVRLESLGAEPLLEAGEGSVGVYRHGFEVVVDGTYLGTLDYLRALEALPWSFFWESLDYEVIDHPLGRARIRAWTLGAGEEWFGV
jgi:MSHA biogenesis protein MshJ